MRVEIREAEDLDQVERVALIEPLRLAELRDADFLADLVDQRSDRKSVV